MENIIIFSNLNIDKAIQLSATYNFINHHGILLSTAFVSDLTKIQYTTFAGWPPGFTFLILPFTLLSSNIIVASVIADCFYLILFFFGIYKLLNLLFKEKSREYFALFCLLNMFSFTPIYYFTSTDRYALTFFVIALYYFVKRINNADSDYKSSLLAAIFIFLSALTRFAYFPIALVLTASLALVGKLKNDRQLYKNGISSLAVTLVLCASLYTFQKLYYGSGTYLEQKAFSLHFENLLQFDPIFFKSYFFIETFQAKLATSGLLSISIKAITLIVSFSILFIYCKRFLKNAFRNPKNNIFYFDLVSILIVAATTGTLMLLSILSPPQMFAGNPNWTYVEESRYFAPAILIIQIFILRLFFDSQPSRLRSVSKWFVAASLIYGVCYFTFKHVKVFVKNDKVGTFAEDKKPLLDFGVELKKITSKENPILVASTVEMVRYFSIFNGGIPVNSYDSLLLDSTVLPKGKTILIECATPKSLKQENFIAKNSGKFAFRIEDMDWYEISVP